MAVSEEGGESVTELIRTKLVCARCGEPVGGWHKPECLHALIGLVRVPVFTHQSREMGTDLPLIQPQIKSSAIQPPEEPSHAKTE